MKSRIESVVLCMSLFVFCGQCAVAPAEAASDGLGIKVFETRDFVSNVDSVYSEKVGIYGAVLSARDGRVSIQDRLDASELVEADIRLIPPEDKLRLSVECVRLRCLQIITGFVVRGKLRATDVHWLGDMPEQVKPADIAIPPVQIARPRPHN